MKSISETVQDSLRKEDFAEVFNTLNRTAKGDRQELDSSLAELLLNENISAMIRDSFKSYLQQIDYKLNIPMSARKPVANSMKTEPRTRNVTFTIDHEENQDSTLDTVELSIEEPLRIPMNGTCLVAEHYQDKRIMLCEEPCNSYTTSYEFKKQQIFGGCRYLMGKDVILHIERHNASTLHFSIQTPQQTQNFVLQQNEEIHIGKLYQDILRKQNFISGKQAKLWSKSRAWFIENLSSKNKMYRYFYVQNIGSKKIVVDLTQNFSLRSGKHLITAHP